MSILGTVANYVGENVCPAILTKKVPWLSHHITRERMTEILRNKGILGKDTIVAGCKLTPFAVGQGLMSIMYRAELTYQPEASTAPSSVVLKLAPPDLKARIVGEVLSNFKSEVNFYTNKVQKAMDIRAPECYYAGHSGKGRFCLVLEDLAPSKPKSQVLGITVEEAEIGVKTLAKIHARFRGNVESNPLFAGWLLAADEKTYWDLVAKTYCDSAKKLEHVFHEQLKLTDCDALLQVMLRTKDLIRPFIDQMKLDLKRNGGPLPGTLMHGDFRSDNLFFPDDHCDTLRVIDFQLLREGQGETELCYFLGGSMTIENRRKHERDLIQLYYDEMLAHGVTNYSMSECLASYQMGCLNIVVINAIAATDGASASPEAAALIRTIFQRTAALTHDWETLSMMEKIAGKERRDYGEDHPTIFTPQLMKWVIPEAYHALIDSNTP